MLRKNDVMKSLTALRFGRNGSEIGEFDGPNSTAVLTDGGIVVCDYGNDRIQIFE